MPGSLIESELIADRTQSSPFFAGDFSDTVSNIGRIGIRQSLSEQWKAEAEFTYRDNDRDFQNGFRSFFFIAAPSSQSRVTRSINPRLVGTLPFRGQNATLTIGSDYEDTGYTLVSQLGTQTLEQRIVAAFAQTIVPLTEKVTATGGLRRARVNNDIVSAPAFGETEAGDIDDTVSAFSAGIVYKPVNNVKLFARVDENYRFATVEEHIDPTFIYPVPEPLGLDTQTGLSKEVGVQLTADSAMLKISAYRIDLDNEIIFDAAAFSSTNLDETRREGFTVSGNWSPTSGVTLSGAYSYVAAEIPAGS
ncbi:MAG TPA: TonB-dependent receptor, partial [Chromatiaceae bacterium]|nr:TonB-dependent receptor [Chromatiaceae bacterium]